MAATCVRIKIADVIRKQWPLVALPAAAAVRPAVEDAATTTTTTATATTYSRMVPTDLCPVAAVAPAVAAAAAAVRPAVAAVRPAAAAARITATASTR